MIITFLFIALIIAIILMIGLLVQNVSISRKYKQENEKLNNKDDN